MKLKAVLTAALLLAPTAAMAAPGIVTESTGLRAGPGRGFPMVDRIPGGARVHIHGCLRGDAWCDVSWSDDRGWVSSQYLEYLYRDSYVYLPDYVDEIEIRTRWRIGGTQNAQRDIVERAVPAIQDAVYFRG